MSKRVTALGQLLQLSVLLNEDMTQALGKLGLTTSRTHLLWELQQNGPATQRDLAQALKVSARNITGLVDGLVSTGFVTREPHPTDRRATLVSFTEHGADVMAQMAKDHKHLADLLFGGLPELDGFIKNMDHVLAQLQKAIEEEAGK